MTRPRTEEIEERFLPLEGSLNFRDLGGRPTASGRRVRWGRLYRADALHHLTERDVTHLRDAVGLRTIVDLRSTSESDSASPRLLAPPVVYHRIPLFERERSGEAPSGLGLDMLYFAMMGFAQPRIARVVELLAAARDPAVFHCAAGKDRTGVVAAVVLGALGVPDEEIVQDYACTRRSLDRIIERLRATAGYEYVFSELPPETLHAEPDTMERLLRRVGERWGSMQGYLLEAGLAEDTLARLAASLLEPA
jgi:protein tyrosine/serine phosphatase